MEEFSQNTGTEKKSVKNHFHPLFSCTSAAQVGEYSCSMELYLGTRPNRTKYREAKSHYMEVQFPVTAIYNLQLLSTGFK